MDDSRSYIRVFKAGTRFNQKLAIFRVVEDSRVEDEEVGKDLVKMTQEQYLQALNSISPNLN